MQVDEEEKFLMSREEAFNKIVTFTGGRAAEELIFNTRTTGASNDIEQATKIARAMITRYGMSDEFGFVSMETVNNRYLGGDTSLSVSDRRAFDIDLSVNEIITKAQEKSHEILSENIDSLHAISHYLLKRETITGVEFMDILNKNSDHHFEGGSDSLNKENKEKNEESSVVEEESSKPSVCLLYTSPSPRDVEESRMPSSA